MSYIYEWKWEQLMSEVVSTRIGCLMLIFWVVWASSKHQKLGLQLTLHWHAPYQAMSDLCSQLAFSAVYYRCTQEQSALHLHITLDLPRSRVYKKVREVFCMHSWSAFVQNFKFVHKWMHGADASLTDGEVCIRFDTLNCGKLRTWISSTLTSVDT